MIYPALQERRDTKDLGWEAQEEHAVVEHLLEKLSTMPFDYEKWGPTLKALKENIEHHVEEEEDEMFKEMKKIWEKDGLKQLGSEVVAYKEAAN